MLFFRGAGDSRHDQGWYGIGKVCQGTRVQLERFTRANQIRCRNFFAENNLLLNGDFASGDLIGWTELGRTATVITDREFGDHAVVISGDEDGTPNAIYQRLELSEGTVIKFSAYIRIRSEISSNVQLLYVGFIKPDGSSVGNALSATDINLQSNKWTYVEHLYTLPPAQDERYLFAPAQVRGSRQVDVARVQLEILGQP